MSTPTSRSNPSLYSTFAQNGSAYSQTAYLEDTSSTNTHPTRSTRSTKSHYLSVIPSNGSASSQRRRRRSLTVGTQRVLSSTNNRLDDSDYQQQELDYSQQEPDYFQLEPGYLQREYADSPSAPIYETTNTESCDEYAYPSSNYYLTHNTTYTQEPYSQELQIEDEPQHPTTTPSHQGYPGLRRLDDYLQPEHNSQETEEEPESETYSPTHRWSREYSPEERMRLGLRRWESDEVRATYEEQQTQGYGQREEGRRSY